MASILRRGCGRICASDGISSLLKISSVKVESFRGMARSRNYPIKGASMPSGITEEIRDLLANVKNAENIDEWNRNPRDPEPIKFQPLRPNPEDFDNDQFIEMAYYPHRGEDLSDWSKDPSPVLLVERIKPVRGEPWWHKETCEKFGLGAGTHNGKRVAVPNMSHYAYKLYTIKHLIKVTPVQFPEELPSEEEFDPRAAEVTFDGRFVYHPNILEKTKQIEDGLQNGERVAIQGKTFSKQAYWDFRNPWGSPLGNHNYHRNTKYRHPGMKNRVTDSAFKVQY